VTGWLPRLNQEARLRQATDRLGRNPDDVALRFERASLLRALGAFEAAKQEYLDVARRMPGHLGALNDLGTMLCEAGFLSAARVAYAEAIRHHPDDPVARVNLANLLLAAGDPAAARAHYETALGVDPDHAHAHRGMAHLLAQTGDHVGADRHRDQAFRGRFMTTMPYRGAQEPLPILLLVSALDGNIPTRQFLDESVFLTSVLIAEYYETNCLLPPHRLIFNSVGDADLCGEALRMAAALAERSSLPVINHPATVRATGRLANAERLGRLPDVIAPRVVSLPRPALLAPDAASLLARRGLTFPLLVRSPGFHTGRHFVRVDTAADLPAAVGPLPGDDLWAMQFIDTRGRDGKTRKYRVMIVDGTLYPLHLAVSDHWKVHYFTADMADNAQHRAEDAAFLNDMAGVLGQRAMRGLTRIRDALGLDYAGVDFALGPAGEVVLFEANATMTVNPPPSETKWEYRRAPVERIFAAVRAMLLARGASKFAAVAA